MKNFKKITLALFVFAFAAGMTSCSDDANSITPQTQDNATSTETCNR